MHLAKKLLILGVVVTLQGCNRRQEPEAQRAWSAELHSLQSGWDQTRSNAIQREAYAAAARQFFTTVKDVSDWEAEVKDIKMALGGVWAVVENDGVIFKLFPEDNDRASIALLSKIGRGSHIVFTGKLIKETSFTMDGAMREPEMQVKVSSLREPGR